MGSTSFEEYFKFRITIVSVQVCNNFKIFDVVLGPRKDPDLPLDSSEPPFVLVFKVVAV